MLHRHCGLACMNEWAVASFPGLQSPYALGDWRPGNEAKWAGLNVVQIPFPLWASDLIGPYLGQSNHRIYGLTVIMASILRRPVDLFVVSVFLVFLLIAATIGKIFWTTNTRGVACKNYVLRYPIREAKRLSLLSASLSLLPATESWVGD